MMALQSKTMVWSTFIGWAQRLYDELRDFLRERIQGGKPLIQHSYVEVMLGQIAVDIEATRSLAYRAGWEIEQALKAGAPINMYWSQALLNQVKNMMFRVANIAGDLYGGVGATYDMPLQSFVRTAFTWQIGGTTRSNNAVKCSREYDNKYSY